MKNKRLFLKAFLKNPLRTGSIIQSSPYLITRMLKKVDLKNSRCVIELGGGTGVVTKEILKKLGSGSLLLCFEVVPDLAKKLASKIKDPRLIVICDSAENIDKHLANYKISKVDCIVSGLPLASLPPRTSHHILKSIYAYLKCGGQYIQFQYSLVSLRNIRYLFSNVSVSFVFLNIPPAFVYICTKM